MLETLELLSENVMEDKLEVVAPRLLSDMFNIFRSKKKKGSKDYTYLEMVINQITVSIEDLYFIQAIKIYL